MSAPTAHLELMQQGEAFLHAQMAGLGDTDLAGPALLPGWTRSHVLAHCARNADALRNLITWARTGDETPMYASSEERAADIESAARQAPLDLRADVLESSARLLADIDLMDARAWQTQLRTAARLVTADVLPWMRIRETWIHGIDLGAGASFADLPKPVLRQLIDEVAAGLLDRQDCPAVVAVSGDLTWRIGGAWEPVKVEGDLTTVAAWLIGRPGGELLGAPAAPPWL